METLKLETTGAKPTKYIPEIKVCSRCKTEKPAKAFGLRSNKRWLRAECKKCTAARIKAKYIPRPKKENLTFKYSGKKLCCNCKEYKNLSEFSKNRSGPGGYNSRCKVCAKLVKNYKTNAKKHSNKHYYKYHEANKLKRNENSKKAVKELKRGYLRSLARNRGIPKEDWDDYLEIIKSEVIRKREEREFKKNQPKPEPKQRTQSEIYTREGYQACKSCKKEKPLEDFHKGISRNGRQYDCKDCTRTEMREIYLKKNSGKFSTIYYIDDQYAKYCNTCKELKLLAEFWNHPRNSRHHKLNRCKSCEMVHRKNHPSQTTEVKRLASRKQRELNKDKINENARITRKKQRDRLDDSYIRQTLWVRGIKDDDVIKALTPLVKANLKLKRKAKNA